MSLFKRFRNFMQGTPAPEVIDDSAMDVPTRKPDPRTLLPKDHIDYIKPENITEAADRLNVNPPNKL